MLCPSCGEGVLVPIYFDEYEVILNPKKNYNSSCRHCEQPINTLSTKRHVCRKRARMRVRGRRAKGQEKAKTQQIRRAMTEEESW